MSKVESKVENKVETSTSDAKKLALRCKTLEMQLRQSIPKKDHHEITSKLEKQIDELERDLDRAKEENRKTIALNKQIAGVEEQISSLIKGANFMTKTLASIEDETTTRGKAQSSQWKILDALAAKVTQGTVPASVHLQSLTRARDFESRCEELSRQLGTMVPSSEYSSLKERFDEATRQLSTMVAASDYSALKQRVEELEGAIASMVPREQLASSEARVKELEARLAEHVPQSIYDELVSRVVSLAEAVTGGELQPEETAAAEAQTEAAEVETPAPATNEAEPESYPIPEELTPDETAQQPPQVDVPAPPQVDVPAPAEAAAPENPVPEIREVQSQLAEINSQAQEAKGGDITAPAPTSDIQVDSAAFAFSGTDVVVRTGAEFIQAIEKLPADVLESHIKSGDLEKWFAGALSDQSTADSLRKVREAGTSGEELRSKVRSSLAGQTPVVEPPAQEAPATTA